jgi:putative transposase
VYLLDGSSLELKHTAELVAAYPPAENQFGQSHWPVLRIAVMHNLANGLALRPNWGPMYGPNAVSEQALVAQLMERLVPQAIIVGDRNFGIFSTAYDAQQHGHPVVLRLTAARFNSITGGPGFSGQDMPVIWKPSRWDRKAHPELPADAEVKGRVIVAQLVSGTETELLYLFTTLDLPAEEVLEIYGRRWYVETDLRSLKTTIHLHQLTSQSVSMMEKELVMAIAAYNIVRAVMG